MNSFKRIYRNTSFACITSFPNPGFEDRAITWCGTDHQVKNCGRLYYKTQEIWVSQYSVARNDLKIQRWDF